MFQTVVYTTTKLDQYQKTPLLSFSLVVSLLTTTFIPTVQVKRKKKKHTHTDQSCIWSAVKAKPLKHFDKHTPLVLQVKWSAGQYGPAPSLESTHSSSARPPQIKGFSLSFSPSASHWSASAITCYTAPPQPTETTALLALCTTTDIFYPSML